MRTPLARALIALALLAAACAARPPGAQAAPASGQIAYVQNGNLWLLDLAGGSARQLTTNGESGGPAWSPDGQWIVFSRRAVGPEHLWRIRPDGSGLEQVTNNPLADMLPAYSPAGALYWVRVINAWRGSLEESEPPGHFLVMRRQGTGPETQVYDSGERTCFNPAAISVGAGDKLAISLVCHLGLSIAVVDLAQGGPVTDSGAYFQTRLDAGYCAPGLKAQQAAQGRWAHTAARLAFLGDADCATAGTQGYRDGIYVYDPLDPNATPTLVDSSAALRLDYPAWSPDDQWLVYQRGDHLALVSAAGGPVRTLPAVGVTPAWRPTAAPPPGMPSTGGAPADLGALGALALALLLAGTGARRAARR
jgi:hypothetical protein